MYRLQFLYHTPTTKFPPNTSSDSKPRQHGIEKTWYPKLAARDDSDMKKVSAKGQAQEDAN